MEVTGTIKRIGETQTFGSKGFTKRDLVLETYGKYPQTVLLEFHKDNCDLLDKAAEGEGVKISFNLQGREWTNPENGSVKVFNTLVGWKIEGVKDLQDELSF